MEQTFLIVDRLDEAHAGDRKQILTFLFQLNKRYPGTLKVLTSAQPEADLGPPFRNDTTIATIYPQGRDM